MPRLREYDDDALITLATEAFWSRGYRGTSVEHLVSESGVGRASLYSAYPDKRALFIESLRHYLDGIVRDNIARLNGLEPAGAAVHRFFAGLVEAPLSRLRRGCLLTNSAVELGLEDREAARLIRQAFARMEQSLYLRLVQAKKAGELPAEVDPRAYARQLVALLQGIRVMARVGVGRETLRDAVAAALAPLAVTRAKKTAHTANARPRAPVKPLRS